MYLFLRSKVKFGHHLETYESMFGGSDEALAVVAAKRAIAILKAHIEFCWKPLLIRYVAKFTPCSPLRNLNLSDSYTPHFCSYWEKSYIVR